MTLPNQNRWDDLEKFFDAQISKLKSKRCSDFILKEFCGQRATVLSKAFQLSFDNKLNIPFLPVIARPVRNIARQMSMTQNGYHCGYCCLNLTFTTDQLDVPVSPYYIFDVEDGRETINKNIQKARLDIGNQGRSCLATAEIISLSLHTENYLDYGIIALNSRYNIRGIPAIYLFNGRPELGIYHQSGNIKYWGVPSCASRLFPETK